MEYVTQYIVRNQSNPEPAGVRRYRNGGARYVAVLADGARVVTWVFPDPD